MPELSEHIQRADWKKEKHVPVAEVIGTPKAGEMFDVVVSLGKEVDHPNTTEHHIRWVSLYYHAKGEKSCYQVGHVEFAAHGESVEGANEGPVHAHHKAVISMKVAKSGMLHAVAFCNIHGLWESTQELELS